MLELDGQRKELDKIIRIDEEEKTLEDNWLWAKVYEKEEECTEFKTKITQQEKVNSLFLCKILSVFFQAKSQPEQKLAVMKNELLCLETDSLKETDKLKAEMDK